MQQQRPKDQPEDVAPEDVANQAGAAEGAEGAEQGTETEVDLAAELKAAHDKLLRQLAEMENLRRRHSRELEEARKYAAAGFARDLLDVADNMRRAIAAIPDEAREQQEVVRNLLEGVELTERTLLAAFDKHGVKKVVPERGEKFDHNRHQAMFEVPTADLPPGHVADVMQTGWVIADRLLRPAMVGVTKTPPQPAKDEAAQNEPSNDAAGTRGGSLDTQA